MWAGIAGALQSLCRWQSITSSQVDRRVLRWLVRRAVQCRRSRAMVISTCGRQETGSHGPPELAKDKG